MFPDIITQLPQADIPIENLKAFLVQGNNQQVLFMEFDSDTEVAEHSHEAQWGVVLDGEIEFNINNKKHLFRKGDTYYIPKDVVHSAKIKKGYKDITLFDQKNRYSTKSN